MKILKKSISDDNKNMKFLQLTDDGIITETAYIEEEDRYIICYASQLGCPIGCKFCYNGIYKNFYRNLTDLEIIEECLNVVKELQLDKKQKTILFSCMGVGEPLLNYKNVVIAIKKLNELYPNSKFALATTGIKPKLISKLATDLSEIKFFKLTISLHASNERIRKQIIPIDVSLEKIKKELTKFKENSNHRYEWNYLLLDGINDDEDDAIELLNFIDKNDKIKISCLNEIKGCEYKPSKNIEKFKKVLESKGINYKIFNSSGVDIEVGCGQMITAYNNIKEKIENN